MPLVKVPSRRLIRLAAHGLPVRAMTHRMLGFPLKSTAKPDAILA